ncbi:MAG: aminopeptidase P family protein [Lachnospiraceae bacterium]|nr:aminopeptidase P family protein [Lachnospiraceae bacterium]
MSIYKDRIKKLQESMQRLGVDYYLIPLADYHNSEYFDSYYNIIKYMSGFRGSNAALVITRDKAYMWTDGRYFIQAEMQIKRSGIILMKQGMPDTPTVVEFLSDKMCEDDVLAFDGRLVSVEGYERYNNAIKRGRICDADLISDLWENRGEPVRNNVWILSEEYAGESVEQKLLRIRGDENYNKADALIVTDLCDIAWALNMRGSDISHMPVFYSYLIITKRNVILYADMSCLTDTLSYLEENGVTVKDYEEIYKDLSDKQFYNSYGIYKTLIDDSTCNTAIFTMLNENSEVLKSAGVIRTMKCIKNRTEIKNIKNAHIKDGIAMCKFLYFLDKAVNEGCDTDILVGEIDDIIGYRGNGEKKYYTELSLVEILHRLRSEQEGFIEESFDTISAWAEHGAIVHYEPTPKTNATIGRDNFLLVDSGGHYLEGTTDITRTILIGDASLKMVREYTMVLKSNIALARAVFYDGVGGKSLDMLARNEMWQRGYDYMHGTGHGVGYLLSVHEGPNNISIRNRRDVPIRPGMVTTDEPGIYLRDEYGIRLENELLCKVLTTNEYGKSYNFECLTLAPFQLECIDSNYLTVEEKDYLNSYHKKVYKLISPHLTKDEADWLKEATKEI